MTAAVLVACAHGTRADAGQRAVRGLVHAVGESRPGLVVRDAFVDVQEPSVADVVREVTDAGGRAVVVPLLLSAGYHVAVDIGDAVRGRGAVAAPALGPDDRLTDLLHDRLREALLSDDDAIVLAAAGSSDPAAVRAVERVAADLRGRHPGGTVVIGYGAAASPTVADAVAAVRAGHPGRRIVVASYLLAPGHFHGRLRDAGADVVTAPLLTSEDAPDRRLVELVLHRYDEGVRGLPR